jgi:hypothetical protein
MTSTVKMTLKIISSSSRVRMTTLLLLLVMLLVMLLSQTEADGFSAEVCDRDG